MKKIFKALLFILIGVIVLVGAASGYVYFFLPKVEKAPDLKVTITPERVEHGKYLAMHVAVCIDCHSTRDYSQYSGPMITGTEGKGGDKFAREYGFPGNFYARNITPYKLATWSDGEIFRAITSGVSKDGSVLFPLMPYNHFGKADKEDVYDIIAYIRSLPSIQNEVPESKADFPVNILMHLAPEKTAFVTRPAASDTVKYGEYLVRMSSCVECHSKENHGQVIEGTEFGGGREFILPWGTVRTPNITNHATGIAAFTADAFVKRFKQYTDSSYRSPKMTMSDFNTPMPWIMYAGMKESDLRSVYAYLRTVKPIDNKVDRFTPLKK